MSVLLNTLTFNALQQKPMLSRHCANRELFHHVVSKWDIPNKSTSQQTAPVVGLTTVSTSRPPRKAPPPIASFSMVTVTVSTTTGPCSGVWALHYVSTASDHWQIFGFDDIKGGVALRIRSEEVFLSQYSRKNGDHRRVWRAMDGLKEQRSKENVGEPYLETLPQELVDSISAPSTGDPALLEELNKFVEDNRVFKEDMLELLNYLASDQCVHGYDNLVAGYEA
ncbi:hypothetical protein BGZ96_000659 [Linnemannia gamsii]|uniref:Uncharacterized protein n=1 Tax=Linnemannia gamsii TaxID=64522 RepID=A0ABQ7JNL0_9FUNG|nr:hypothetical protein BGZ96_000659 [Linnemannia gamsii]